MEAREEESRHFLGDVERQQADGEAPATAAAAAAAAPFEAQDRSTAFLDGLRGLAALFVFVQHYIGGFDGNVHEFGFGQAVPEQGRQFYFASLPFVRIVFSGGSAAVAIFFVLSGYVLSKSPLRLLRDGRRRAAARALASAVVRRPFRLYVPTLAVTLLHALLVHLPFDILPAFPWSPAKANVLAELAHWAVESFRYFQPFQTFSSDHAWYAYSLVVWTIPLELQGSMLIYATLALYAALAGRLGPAAAAALLLAASAVLLQLGCWAAACFLAGLALSLVDVNRLDLRLLSGCCCRRRRLGPRAQSAAAHAVFLAGYYLICQPAHAGSPEYSLDTPGWRALSLLTPAAYGKGQYFRYWHSWGALLLIYAALRIAWLQRLLHARPLRYLGKVSFMLYLVHIAVLEIIGNRLSRFFGLVYPNTEPSWWNNRLPLPDVGPRGPSLRFLVCVALVLPVVLLVSDFGTRYIDRPSVRLGKKIAQLLGLDQARAGGKEGENGTAGVPMQQLRLASV